MVSSSLCQDRKANVFVYIWKMFPVSLASVFGSLSSPTVVVKGPTAAVSDALGGINLI